MYITITAQKVQGNYAQSAADFVDYLEKENEGKPLFCVPWSSLLAPR